MVKKSVDELQAKLLQISEFIAKLDPAIRAAAFDILRPQYFGEPSTKKIKIQKETDEQDDVEGDENKEAPSDLAGFISKYNHKKPADNVLLLVAWLYSSYGAYSITAKEVKELGDACGLVVPGRPDNTMRQATKNGKNLFSQQGKGWKPTVSGELYLKEIYSVKKGNTPLSTE